MLQKYMTKLDNLWAMAGTMMPLWL